ncbi:uncharacterized protein BJX67DRAFT_367498 [Aspergillus lucknowensis]|uniref:Uncharacterized protein n=1 Tax=Aspergillus lucknowensis TaxID=176173 RepID=A0ABR4L924_9EURO
MLSRWLRLGLLKGSQKLPPAGFSDCSKPNLVADVPKTTGSDRSCCTPKSNFSWADSWREFGLNTAGKSPKAATAREEMIVAFACPELKTTQLGNT